MKWLLHCQQKEQMKVYFQAPGEFPMTQLNKKRMHEKSHFWTVLGYDTLLFVFVYPLLPLLEKGDRLITFVGNFFDG